MIIPYLILAYIVILIIAGIINAINSIISKIKWNREQKFRDSIAHEILDGIDLRKESESIININKKLNFALDESRCPECGGDLNAPRQLPYAPGVPGYRDWLEPFVGYSICSRCNIIRRTY